MVGTVYDELEVVRQMSGGTLKPEDVVEYAKDPDTKLHSRFEWDDSKAGPAYRIWQARMIIRTTVTIIEGTTESIRAFVSLAEDRGSEGYRAMVEVMADDDTRMRLLAQARKDAEVFQKKYKKLAS